MDLIILVSSIIYVAILLMIRGELKDIAESLYKIAKHLEQIDEKDEN
ncbi:MAG: hypothetical protein OXU23_16715 [Candidatus Poribacteria bacterium]|nr:hypothetical protein [Candidatus Poribacteria bacterium]